MATCGFGTLGCLLLPCCCTGLLAIVPAVELADQKRRINKAIAIYGSRKACQVLGKHIQQEIQFFTGAMSEVNATCGALEVQRGVQLMTIIAFTHPRLREVLENSGSTISRFLVLNHGNAAEKPPYLQKVWDAYVKKGGNYEVVVYGFLEYLCCTHEPTSNYVMGFVDDFVSESSPLYVECMAHKAAYTAM
ncbi:hypothetical protein HXX76_014118 [Chlamydomonas incerta]|uniref:Uncharacterized protein n=1 Tax=Chlamydomonas incerta TaxID=51695 RepID=A0A835VRD3_CHLIN|nr:hypothetical protein HXX76_014118 [Chlamydomonas incerta]|eukprot:KAG2424960.1 hypothetical protein HXX76_014118 [Chlamydomonas incerta]